MGPAPLQADLAIEDVTVIDPESGRVSQRQTVYVDEGRIVDISAAKGGPRITALTRVDGENRFLIPGLMDMHVHLFLPADPTPSLKLLLANGVTSIREMSSDCWALAGAKKGCIQDYRQLQSAVREGRTIGPDLSALTSTMVMGLLA